MLFLACLLYLFGCIMISCDKWSVWLLTIIHLWGRNSLFKLGNCYKLYKRKNIYDNFNYFGKIQVF